LKSTEKKPAQHGIKAYRKTSRDRERINSVMFFYFSGKTPRKLESCGGMAFQPMYVGRCGNWLWEMISTSHLVG